MNELKEDVLTNLLSFEDNPKLVLDDTVGIFDTEKSKGKDAILTTYLALDGYGLSAKAERYSYLVIPQIKSKKAYILSSKAYSQTM